MSNQKDQKRETTKERFFACLRIHIDKLLSDKGEDYINGFWDGVWFCFSINMELHEIRYGEK